MALAYDAAGVTRDVDAMFKPHGIVHEEALNRRCQSAPIWQAVIVIYPARAINGYRQRQLQAVSAVVISRSHNADFARAGLLLPGTATGMEVLAEHRHHGRLDPSRQPGAVVPAERSL